MLDELRVQLSQKIERKQAKIEAQIAVIDRTRQTVFAQIDTFFNKIIEIAQQRKD